MGEAPYKDGSGSLKRSPSPEREASSKPVESGIPDGAVNVLTSVFPGILLGIDMSDVYAIQDGGTSCGAAFPSNSPPEMLVDLAESWAVSLPRLEASRRIVVVSCAHGRRRVAVGEKIAVQTVARGAFADLPAYVKGVSARTAIRGVFLANERIGYLLDVDGLDACHKDK